MTYITAIPKSRAKRGDYGNPLLGRGYCLAVDVLRLMMITITSNKVFTINYISNPPAKHCPVMQAVDDQSQ